MKKSKFTEEQIVSHVATWRPSPATIGQQIGVTEDRSAPHTAALV